MISSYEAYLNALYGHESMGSGNYQADNGIGYIGRYQMGKDALIDAGYRNKQGSWTGKNGIWSDSDFKNSPISQEDAIRVYDASAWQSIQNAGFDKYIGQTINGVEITPYGLLAGYHLKGNGGLKKYLESGGQIDPTDKNKTPISKYIKNMGGYGDIPDTGIPVDNDAAYTPPAGIPDPAADNPGFFDSIGDGVSDAWNSIGSGVSGVFSSIGGALSSGFQAALSSLPGAAMGLLASRLGGRMPDIDPTFSYVPRTPMRPVLNMTSQGIGRQVAQSRRGALERDLIDMVFGGGGGILPTQTPPFMPGTSAGNFNGTLNSVFGGSGMGGFGNMLFNHVGNMIGGALSRTRTRTRTSSQESDRSVSARQSWNTSGGQQAALLAQIMQQGTRNL